MKRAISTLLACLLLCGLAACGVATEQPTETQAITEPTEPEFTTQVVEAMIDPEFEAEALFKRLEGIWDTPHPELEGIYGFISFIYRDGKPSFYSGVYDGETNGVGTLIGGNGSEGIATLYFQYPAVEDWPGPFPERTEELQIDGTRFGDGTLHIRHKTIWGTSEWRACTYRCKTLQEAGIRAIW